MRRAATILPAAILLLAAACLIWVRIPESVRILSVTPTDDTSPLSDYERRSNHWLGYDIRIGPADAATIAWREAYVHAILFDCANPASDYPAEALATGGADEFDTLRAAARAKREVVLHAFVPVEVAARPHLGCVRLEGSSYFLGSVRSRPARLPPR